MGQVIGTSRPDVITPGFLSTGVLGSVSSGGDVIYPGAGDDSVLAGSGRDTVFGSDGDDTLVGGAGPDERH